MYQVQTDELAKHQVDALPQHALNLFAELRTVLEVSPWSGDPANATNPDAQVRMLTFGPQHEGMVTYLILEDQRRVDVLQVVWLG